MGSRRTILQSSFGNGRSSSGEDMNGNGNSRPGACSYLSNVRPENRSTLCSVIAQLTEETQPAFETTLKSKAVSENSNVKFSCAVTGYPTPQVLWYKDDMQLDRYCGLPKYEIFCNGKSHSLHIYNCSVDDAAMYQASASNAKGIVSCSGILEVGEMNEFKIHQRYFAKIKKKAEGKHKEVEGKENQEPPRAVSPERLQRKRRSPMNTFLSTPNAMEDKAIGESDQVEPDEPEARLQGPQMEQDKEKPVHMTNGAASAITNGQPIHESGSGKTGTYIYDQSLKMFTAHQPKTPFVKKKIKISNISKVLKADTQGEALSEKGSVKAETSTTVAPGSPESVHFKSEEVMEVEPVCKNLGEHHLKSTDFVEKFPMDKMISQNKQFTSLSHAACTSTNNTTSGIGKQTANHALKTKHKVKDKNMEIQPSYMNSTQEQQSTIAAFLKPPSTKIEVNDKKEATLMDADEKSSPHTNGAVSTPVPESVTTPCERRTALSQHPRQQTGDQLPEKETSLCQKNTPVPQPVPLSEVTQAHEKIGRNDTPVSLEQPPDQYLLDAQPSKKTTSGNKTDDTQRPSVHHSLQEPIAKLTQDTQDHSRGSNESHTVLFTDLQKSLLKSLSGGEDTQGCNVSPTKWQSQVDSTIKSVEGTEIQVDEKEEGNNVGKTLVQGDSGTHKNEQTKREKKGTEDIGGDILKNNLNSRTENPIQKTKDRKGSESQIKPAECENALRHQTPMANKKAVEVQPDGFQEIPNIETKVISVAELLRSQIKALGPTVVNVPTISAPIDNVEAADKEPKNVETISGMELKPSVPEKNYENITDETSTTIMPQDAMSPPVPTIQKSNMIHPVADPAVVMHNSAIKCNKGSVDKSHENDTSNMGHLKEHPIVSDSDSENLEKKIVSVTCKEIVTERLTPSSSLSGNVSQESGMSLTVKPLQASTQESTVTILDHDKTERGQDKSSETIKSLTPKIELNDNIHCKNIEVLTTNTLGQYKSGEYSANTGGQKFPIKSVVDTDAQVKDPELHKEVINPTTEVSPLLHRRDSVSPIPSATPQELASGARRKILMPKAKLEEGTDALLLVDNLIQKDAISIETSKQSSSPVILPTSPSFSQQSPHLQPTEDRTAPVEKRSLLSRRKMTSDTFAPNQPTEAIQTKKTDGIPAEKDKHDPRKAPQVIRKIRSETFTEASGHLKLWCQFFNVVSDSTIKWYKNHMEVAQIQRKAGDESQVGLAIVQASSKDSGVYRCVITNEYGTDSTEFRLSTEILAAISLCEDIGVGEEIEMTPLIFSKGVADSGFWGNKFFGRIMMQASCIGDGCAYKVWRAKVIYGLEPVFESGNTCIIKARNPIAYGGKEERCLMEKNLDFMKRECKIHNLAREYGKIFSAETRAVEHFGPSLEIIPVYLIYRPANTIPYAIVEADLTGVYQKYSVLDDQGRINMKTDSEVGQKCCALQHWIFQWTNGNLLLTQLEGVETKITKVGITVKSTGHQGLPVEGSPKIFEQFVSQHQCNYFCGLLGLRSLKFLDTLMTPAKPKGSKSPLQQRKMGSSSSSPQISRKAGNSPRLPRKADEECKTPTKQKTADTVKEAKMS